MEIIDIIKSLQKEGSHIEIQLKNSRALILASSDEVEAVGNEFIKINFTVYNKTSVFNIRELSRIDIKGHKK